ncbi:MAG: hypothetical protein QXR57_05325 [Metallosphaera sp.]|uniref:hypothetical protein n=1 Tax=Metallosphaera sp. TaxID=2020860 RepID=UPI003167A343
MCESKESISRRIIEETKEVEKLKRELDEKTRDLAEVQELQKRAEQCIKMNV